MFRCVSLCFFMWPCLALPCLALPWPWPARLLELILAWKHWCTSGVLKQQQEEEQVFSAKKGSWRSAKSDLIRFNQIFIFLQFPSCFFMFLYVPLCFFMLPCLALPCLGLAWPWPARLLELILAWKNWCTWGVLKQQQEEEQVFSAKKGS